MHLILPIAFFLKGNVQSDEDVNVIDGLMVYTDRLLHRLPMYCRDPVQYTRFPQFNSQLDYTQQVY